MSESKPRIGFLFSKDLGKRIIKWVKSIQKEIDFVLVGTHCKEFDHRFLKELCIPLCEYQELLNQNLTTCFSINYWRIIPEEDIKKVKYGIINIHHSYRLRYRGRNTCSWAIIHSKKDNCFVHGSTLHYIDKFLDHGTIIATESCPILPDDTAEDLFKRVEDLGFKIFQENFKRMITGKITSFKKKSKKNYIYGVKDGEDKKVDLNWTEEEIYDYVRAWTFTGKPKPYLKLGDMSIFLDFKKS